MDTYKKLKNLGFSQYEITCYLTLAAHHPINGSRLSRISGIARSRIYDVLRNLIRKGFVLEIEDSQYVPLPPEELYKRLQLQFNQSLAALKAQLTDKSQDAAYEYIWVIRGFDHVIAKAREMITKAQQEIYVRLFPKSGHLLENDLKDAENRGVGIRYIAMGDMPLNFEIQVMHPDAAALPDTIGGCSFDIITDKAEALVGIFENGREDLSPINWTRNRWFVIANRDSLRHDFYHYFLEKIHERKEPLNQHDEQIYTFIKTDH